VARKLPAKDMELKEHGIRRWHQGGDPRVVPQFVLAGRQFGVFGVQRVCQCSRIAPVLGDNGSAVIYLMACVAGEA
jgi:hypothetical protein